MKVNATYFRHMYFRLYTALYGCFHPIEKKILFSSFGGKQYSDSPRMISEAIHNRYPDFILMWNLKSDENAYGIIPEYIQIVPKGKYSFYKELATSFCFVTNEDIKSYIHKRKKQYFIQTWHGDRPFKKVLYDIINNAKKSKSFNVIDGKVTDLCIAASDIGESVYRTAFRYNGEIIKEGMPRNDKLVQNNPEEKNRIRNQLGITAEKILIYAPTFRDGLRDKQEAQIDIDAVLRILEGKGNSWCCLVRAHSSSSGVTINNTSRTRVIDVSDYPDMSDLLLISDMLITDYSSCAGDFIITGKPVIIAAFDKSDYETNCREFKVDPKEAGYFVAETQEELEKIIRTSSSEDYRVRSRDICKRFNIRESGDSSEIIADRINFEFGKKVGN